MPELSMDEAQNIADAINSGGGGGVDGATLAQIMSALQGKMEGMSGLSSGYVEELMANKKVRRRCKALRKCQAESVALMAAYQREIQKLDKQFEPQYAALYDKRASIVTGEYEPTEEECDFEDEFDDEDDEEKIVEEPEDDDDEKKEDEDIVGIPQFWLTCLQNCKDTAKEIQDHDVDILCHLKNVRMEYSPQDDEKDYFMLYFEFDDNEFFTNKVLTKKYFVQLDAEENELLYGGPSYTHSEGCKIEWNKDKDVTVKTIKKKQRKKGGASAGKTRTVVRTEPQESFFNIFSPPVPPADDFEPSNEAEEQKLMMDTSRMYIDFSIADALKEKIIPNAVMWFTGEAQDFEDDDEEEEEEEYEDDDGQGGALRRIANGQDLDDDDDDAHDPDYVPPGNGEKPPECQQS